jgi:hypothetical protein
MSRLGQEPPKMPEELVDDGKTLFEVSTTETCPSLRSSLTVLRGYKFRRCVLHPSREYRVVRKLAHADYRTKRLKNGTTK